MRQGEGGFHDSVEDAQAALDVVLLESRQTEPTHEIDPPAMEIDKKDLCKLFVHRIPRGTSKDRIKAIFTPDDQAHIVSVEGEFLGDAGRTAEAMRDKKTTACFVTFDDSKSADGAFDRIDTPALNVDAMNRPQKFIEIDSDAVKPSPGKNPRVVVRKMNSTAGGVKRAHPSHPNASSTPKEKKKRQRKPKIPLPGDK
jgi:RNA exonuclease 1